VNLGRAGREAGAAQRGACWVLAVLAAAPASAAVSQAPAPTQEVLTLDDAVRLALAGNRGVARAALEVDRAERRLEAGRTKRLPSLDLQAIAGTTLTPIRVSFPAGAFGSYPGIGPIPGSDTVVTTPQTLSAHVSATLAQPLTQLHRIGLGTKANELARDVDRQKLREERASLVADVRRLYYSLLQAESAIRAKEEAVEVYRELERVVEQQAAVETALPSDALDVKARLASERYDLLALQGDLASGKEQMNLLLGRDVAQDFALAPIPETAPEEASLEAVTARALERRPDLAQARLAVEQADTDRRLKKAESIPDVSLAVTYVSFANVDLLPRNVAIAGLQLKWEPFDWGRKGKERAEKELQLEQARSGVRDAEDRARIEIAQRFRKLQEARLLLEANRLNREAAIGKLRVVSARQRQDAALLKDALQAQATAGAAKAQYDQALLNFWTAKADLQKAIGEEE
jgi:outer membrane protein